MSRKILAAAAAVTATGACATAFVLAGPATAADLAGRATPPTASTSAASGSAATLVSTSTSDSCDRAPWTATVEGMPTDFHAGAHAGDYLWHDAAGFHLRVTHANGDRRVFTGEVSSPTPMRLEPVRLEEGDVVRLSADHRSLLFAFSNHGHVDGVDVHTDCAPHLRVSHLNLGDEDLPTGDVYLGAHDVHPGRVPFTVRRGPAADTAPSSRPSTQASSQPSSQPSAAQA